MGRRTFIGGKKGKKKKPPRTKPKPKRTSNKRKKGRRLYSIRQPRKRNIINIGGPRSSFQSMSYSDSSSYSNIMGKKDFKRRANINQNRDGRKRGARLYQDNDKTFIEKYPN
jgi:hypothetical protein